MERNPGRLFAFAAGAALVIVGVIGFFYDATFTDDKPARDAVFGILDVNGWDNVFHIATGVLGLLAFGAGSHAARTYAYALGVVYISVAVWGFIIGSGDSILSIIPVNTADNVLHVALGVLGLAAGYATRTPGIAPPSPATT
jgi:hypothetical protein